MVVVEEESQFEMVKYDLVVCNTACRRVHICTAEVILIAEWFNSNSWTNSRDDVVQ